MSRPDIFYHRHCFSEHYRHKSDFTSWLLLALGLILFLLLLWLFTRWLLDKYWWVDIKNGADPADLNEAEKLAAGTSKGKLYGVLPFTEKKAEWILLYDHAREGQIDPSIIRRMRRSDLAYLAGMAFPHPDLVEPRKKGERKTEAEERHAQATKLLGNVARAQSELNLRNLLWATSITASATLTGVLIGALLT
jgi:hypothetical protein